MILAKMTVVGASLPVVDETAVVYKTGTPANTLTLNVNAFSTARTWAFPDAAATFAGLEVANIYTAAQKINVNSTTALFVERDGVKDNVFIVDTTNGRVAINTAVEAYPLSVNTGYFAQRVRVGLSGGAEFENGLLIADYLGNNKGLLYANNSGKFVIKDLVSGGEIIFSAYTGVGYLAFPSFLATSTAITDYTPKFATRRDATGTYYEAGFSGHATNGDAYIITHRTKRLYIHGSGLVGIGTYDTLPTAQLQIDQNSATGAVPVLLLDQADDSEEMIEFTGNIGTGNAIEAVGAKTLTTTHFIKASITGVGYVYIPVGTIA